MDKNEYLYVQYTRITSNVLVEWEGIIGKQKLARRVYIPECNFANLDIPDLIFDHDLYITDRQNP